MNVFQQDNVPAHRADETVKLLCRTKPDVIQLDFWHPNSPYLPLYSWLSYSLSMTI